MSLINFLVCDINGQIIKKGTCLASDLPLQAGDGEQAIEGCADHKTQMIDPKTLKIVPESEDHKVDKLLREEAANFRKEKIQMLLDKKDEILTRMAIKELGEDYVPEEDLY